MTGLPDDAFAATLAGLDRMTPRRLDLLLAASPAHAAFDAIATASPSGALVARLFDVDGLLAAWQASIARRPPELVWEQCCAHGMSVLVRASAGYPAPLLNDPLPAPVLFVCGDLAKLTGRRAGVVGTRNATAAGRDMAWTLGRDLAAAAVHVVSGLARGIDGCAHRGALTPRDAAGPIGVVASGLDVVYPREHDYLWKAVAETGALISEAAPGTPPEPHRFPLRNRLIAALSEVLVVVESREVGGSLITAREAAARSVGVMAVPGAPSNRAAIGTNALIRDGCCVATDSADVLAALGLDTRRRVSGYDPRPRPSAHDSDLLALCREPCTLDQLVLLSSRSMVDCAMSMARLESSGWLRQGNGWFERVGSSEVLR